MIRFAILYFVLLVVFIGLIVGPAVAGKMILPSLEDSLSNLFGLYLLQPNDLNKDNTRGESQTGTGAPDYSGAGLTMTSSGRRSRASATGRIRLF